MSDFDNLNKYNLLEHGDSREKEWWPSISADFPAYEVFWRNYIVLLTNRIDHAIGIRDQRWIGFREGVAEKYQRLATCHYSVFYFTARATRCLNFQGHVFPEDAFFLLDSCWDNVARFFGCVKRITDQLRIRVDCLPRRREDFPNSFQVIGRYRDILLHNTVLARKVQGDQELLPRPEFLSRQVQDSWRKAAQLPQDAWVDKMELLWQLRTEVVRYLNSTWCEIIEAFSKVRESKKFKAATNLGRFLPISAPPALATTSVEFSASGQQVSSTAPSGTVPLSSNISQGRPGSGNR